jgi:hypothetical protein
MDVENEIKALKLLQKKSAKKERSLLFIIAKPLLLFLLPFLLVLSVFPGPTGKPILDWQAMWDDFASLEFLTAFLSEMPSVIELEEQEVEMYRYRDGKGKIVFSNEAPPEGVQVEKILVSTQINTLGPVPEIDFPETEAQQTNKRNGSSVMPNVNGVTPMNVMQKAKELQAVANERNQALQQF